VSICVIVLGLVSLFYLTQIYADIRWFLFFAIVICVQATMKN